MEEILYDPICDLEKGLCRKAQLLGTLFFGKC
uniref:Uncharacterized protein n=1 Tax=Anopheles funestus TaxID=62324 RepID=A0A182RVC8_ANOFN